MCVRNKCSWNVDTNLQIMMNPYTSSYMFRDWIVGLQFQTKTLFGKMSCLPYKLKSSPWASSLSTRSFNFSELLSNKRRKEFDTPSATVSSATVADWDEISPQGEVLEVAYSHLELKLNEDVKHEIDRWRNFMFFLLHLFISSSTPTFTTNCSLPRCNVLSQPTLGFKALQ